MRLAIGEGARPNTTYKLGVVMSPVPVSENSDTSKAGRVPKIPLQNLNEGTVSTPIVVPAKEEAAWDNSSLESERGGLAVAAAWGLVVLLALFAAHPAGGAWPVLPVVASVVLVTVFLLHQVILLTSWKTKLSHRQEALAAIWIWLLSFLLSMFSSPGRREVLAGDDAWQLREDPGNSTAALWIVLVLFAAAVTVDLGFREFTALGQVIALQHLLISALLQAGSCCSDGAYPSFGGVFLGLPPWLVPSLQLHLLALGFSMVRLWMEQDKQVRAAVNDYLEGKEVPDVLAPGGGGAIKTRIEMITELLDGEIDFLQELLQKVANLASSNRAHVDWMRSVDFLLDLLTSCADVLKQSHVNNDDLEVPDLQDQLSGWIGAGAVGRQQTTPRNTEAAMMPPTASISGGVQQGVTLPGQLSPDGCGSSHSLHLQQSSSGQHWAPPGDSSLQRFADAAKDASSKSMEPIQSELPLKSEDNVRSHLMVGDWSFDALNVAAKHQSVLKIVGKEFLGERGLMPKEHLSAFLDTLESRYDAQNPYHSNVHAADMTNALYFMFENCGLQERTEVSETTVTCMFLAALGHDVGHPGFNNNFLINSRHEFALTYSDRSVLENFHSAELMRLLGGTVKGANLLSSLPVQEQKQERFWMTSLILSTDMSKLMQDLSSLRMKISSGSLSVADDVADQQFVMSWLFRSADIGHSAKPWDIHEAWSMRVVQEFHAQGDEEIRLGLPVSPLCDRADFKLGKSQAGFLQFVCLPTFAEIKNLEEILTPEEHEGASPTLNRVTSQNSIGVVSPSLTKTRTERVERPALAGGAGRRRSIAQLVSSKTRMELCPSPQAPQAIHQVPASPQSTPRNPLSTRNRRPSQPTHSTAEAKVSPEDVLKVPMDSKRRMSLGSSASRPRTPKMVTKGSSSSSLGSRPARVINARIYLQCKKNMETWQRMAQDEETHIQSSPQVSKGSASLAPVSSESSRGE